MVKHPGHLKEEMRSRTAKIFTRPKLNSFSSQPRHPLPAQDGTPLQELKPGVIMPNDSHCQDALSLALKLKQG
ncbi:DNA-binding transcriptional activator GutM [Leclercia adecarboxylata]|uniref:DNA-binding transcriptional activator GutM n=1 Tax=Leclercia adecarboxylata TaxID=83655 RepID=A0A4U9IGX1_9ENTR|nr:DNA-binding transcriptional activator GutM [Leclercia adecarboxylata]